MINFSNDVICRKCGQEKESSYQILCEYPALAGHRIKFFGPAWLKLIDSGTASVRQVLALAFVMIFTRLQVQ
jgi:hypothetical protein